MPQLSMVHKSKVIKGFSPRVFWAYSLGLEGGILILWYNQMARALGTNLHPKSLFFRFFAW